MAVVTANRRGQYFCRQYLQILSSQATNLTPTSFVLTTGSTTVTVTGFGFAYDPNLGLTAGTITGVTQAHRPVRSGRPGPV